MASTELPAGSHYAVVWGIPDGYAGMTRAMLHRSRAFVRLGGAEVTIVTYEFRDDYDAIRAELRQTGELIQGMHLVNLWEDLRGWDDDRLRAGTVRFSNRQDDPFRPLDRESGLGQPLRTTLRNDVGDIEQVDYYREDGTLMVSDRHRMPGPKARAVTLCDTSGQPIGTWDSIWRLYAFWLDSLPREPFAWFVVDSKTVATSFTHYRRPDVVTMHLVHGSHLAAGSTPPYGELAASRKGTFEHLDKWDAVVFLTGQQRSDVELLLGPGSNRYVCPNGRRQPSGDPDLTRPSANGVMLASLIGRKRVDHAIKAVAKAADGGRSRGERPQPRLDVYGDGELRPELERLVRRKSRRADVTLQGFVAGADERLQDASFSLLTSMGEGQPLALIESMAAGCIPISYDIAYGPADVITDRVDGFLVPAGKVREMAEVVRQVAHASPEELAPMRLAAHRRAQDFNDEHVTGEWAAIMRQALDAKRRS